MALGAQLTAAQLPDEMFTIIEAASQGLGPRLGRLLLAGSKPIDTPSFLAITSRGAVPHLAQDNFARATSITGVYVGLEDFIERAPAQIPPVLQFKPPDASSPSPLRRFIALPEETLLVLGARRTPPLVAPEANPNTNTTIAISTAVGFKALSAEDYAKAAEELHADIVVGMADIPYGRALGSKRIEKATDRSIRWMKDHAVRRKDGMMGSSQAKLFAPLLPVTCANQQYYVDCLSHEIASGADGLAIHSLTSLEDLPQALSHLPRLAFTAPETPHDILNHIAAGVDMLTIPFITSATDDGIALDFTFQQSDQPVTTGAPLPLGIDMWPAIHAVNLSPLVRDCTCYACTNHHRAYVQHLLAAKELLGWVLLQIHNHHIMEQFFSAIRQSIAEGNFEEDSRHFARTYESRLPERTGEGPRLRGYQFKSEGPGEVKKNKAPFTKLRDDDTKIEETTPPGGDIDATDLEKKGFAEKQEKQM